MTHKPLLQSICFKFVNCFTLGLLTVAGTSLSVLAEEKLSLTGGSQEVGKLQRQIGKIAILSEAEKLERSQLIQSANILFSQRNFVGAEEKLRQLIKKFPKDAFGYYQLGNILLNQNKNEEAIEEYKKALVLNKNYALAYNGIGDAYASQGRWSDAISAYQTALGINPGYADALTGLAEVFWQQGKRNEAIATLEKAVDAFKAQNRPDKASRVERRLRQLKSTDDPSVS